MKDLTRRDALASAGAMLLAGCGGSSSPTPAPAPAPTPAPVPPPVPTPPPLGSFGTLGATSALTFATLGYSIRGVGTGWDFVPNAASLELEPDFRFRFSPPSSLVLELPGSGEGTLVHDGSGSFSNSERYSAGFTVLGGYLSVYRISAGGAFFEHLMQGYFTSAPDPTRPDPFLNIQFHYGIPVAANTLSTAGAASYAAYAASANARTIQVDFAAGTVTGTVDLEVGGNRPYQFTEVVMNAERTRFSGRLVPADGTTEGRVDGVFYGPSGSEVALRASFANLPQLFFPYLFYARRAP